MRKIIAILLCIILLAVSACEEPDEPVKNTTVEAQIVEAPSPAQPAVETPKAEPPKINPLPPITPTEEPKTVPEIKPTLITPAPAPVPKPTPKPEPQVKSSETPISPTPATEQYTPTDSEELKTMMALPGKKVKSYDFVYAPPPDNLARDHYYIKGNRFRISLYNLRAYRTDTYYDTVYVDTTSKTAVGYCEGTVPGRCRNTSAVFDLSYADFLIKTPYQWLMEIPNGEIRGSEKIFDRPSKEVYYEKDGVSRTLWLDEYSGLPLRVIEEKRGNQTKYEFRYMSINAVTDDYVVHVR